MRKIYDATEWLWSREEGASLAEYALLLGLIAVGLLAVSPAIGQTLASFFTNVATMLSTI